jgi:hypothetical protein
MGASDIDSGARSVIFIGAPDGELSKLAAALKRVLNKIGVTSEITWWAPSAFEISERNAEQIVRDLVGATLVVFDAENGPDLAGYLLGAREALGQYPSVVAYRGAKPIWRLGPFTPTWIDLASIDEAELERRLNGVVPTATNARLRGHANGFRQLGVLSTQLKPRMLEPSGAERVRAKVVGAAPESLRDFRHWQLADTPDAPIVGMTFGDIAKVEGIPAWINPENVDMQMARVVDRSVSACIRARGARRTGARGEGDDDAMFVALAREMGGRSRLNAGEVLLTWVAPGSRLYDDNGVRLVAHAAAVEPRGEGEGYCAAPGLSDCLFNAIDELERRFDQEKSPISRRLNGREWSSQPLVKHAVLSPLLGAGEGGVSAIVSAQMMANALRRWSRGYAERKRRERISEKYIGVHRVYLLARDLSARRAIEGAFAAHAFNLIDDDRGKA